MRKVFEVNKLGKIHGTGCTRCLVSTGPEYGSNICPCCGSVVAAAQQRYFP